jgi:nucleotide-binding universal stress UspA family protein
VRNLVVCSNGDETTDESVRLAAAIAAGDGSVVAVSVLSGSVVDKSLPPSEAGRVRRAAENEAKTRLASQAVRAAGEVDFHAVVLFGDVVADTLLVARNLVADGVVMSADSPDLEAMITQCPVPVVVVPRSGSG